jgi:type I restriction enzyme S subunit
MAREYKDSGIEWIGQIPKEWEVIQVKSLFDISRGRVIPITEMNDSFIYPVYSSQTKNNGCMGYINTYDYNGDALTWTTDGANAGTLFYRTGRFNCTNVCGILQLKPLKIDSSIKFLLYSIGFSAINSRRADINGFKIMSNEMAIIKFVYPSFSEQLKIADYLDKVCGEVDEMVTLQETMIEELKAYKQSVITEAVTKGLNPNVPMRDSGIDWIGEIPEHWEQHQFRRIFEIKKIIAGTLGYDVLSVTQNGIKVKDLTKNEGQIAQDYSKYQLVDVDDYVMNHMDLLTGYVDCSKQNGVTSPDYRVFRAIDKTQISLAYYLKIFQTCYKEKIFYHLGQGVSGMGRWRLPAEQLKLFVLPMPPLSEQQHIASYLGTKCSEIDSLITLKQAKIEELKEYKKSVIYEYVTGKKEV